MKKKPLVWLRFNSTWWRIGAVWLGPWRVEWRRQFEYWVRYQFGPFYLLLARAARRGR